jgi:hypothetical protein
VSEEKPRVGSTAAALAEPGAAVADFGKMLASTAVEAMAVGFRFELATDRIREFDELTRSS